MTRTSRAQIWRPTRVLTGEATGPLDGRPQLESSREEITLDPERGKRLGYILGAESVLGCLGNNVPGQSQGTGQGEAC